MIYLIASRKGGTGKTTVAANLAALLTIQKKDVILVDSDRQESCTQWVQDRIEEKRTPKINTVKATGNIGDTLIDLSKRYKNIVIDVGGYESIELRTALTIADIVIVPTKPSQIDLDTLLYFSELVKRSQLYNLKLKAFCLISQATTHYKSTEVDEAKNYVGEIENIECLDTVIYARKIYRDCIAAGLSVVETSTPAKVEIQNFLKEINLKNSNKGVKNDKN